jgi:hypothetical protein
MTLDISKLLQESRTPLEEMNAYSRTLAPKWEKTGLLDGLKDRDRSSMAVLLENQARQLLKETSMTQGGGTSSNKEEWNGVALPLVRKVFGEVAAKEFVSVQPMNLPSGLLFYLDFQYGTGVAGRTIGDSVYGDTTSSAAPNKGLYGAGRFGYTMNDSASVVVSGCTTGSATSESVNYEISPSGLVDVSVPVAQLGSVDLAAIRTFIPSGAAAAWGGGDDVEKKIFDLF